MNMKHKQYKYLLFFFMVMPAFACQFLDDFFLEQPNHSDNFDPAPTVSSADSPNIIPTSTLTAEQRETLTAENNVGTDADLPTQLDSGLIEPEGLENFSSYISRSGYGFYHPADWLVAEYFGQAVVTDDAQILNRSGTLGERPLIILLTGSVGELPGTAPERLELLQLEILSTLAEGALPTQITLDNEHSQYGSDGSKGTYELPADDQSYTIQSVSLTRSDIYVVGLAIMQTDQVDKYLATAENILSTVQLLSDSYNVSPASYGLSAEEVSQLEQDIQNLSSVATSTQPISLGETIRASTVNGPIIFEFSSEGGTVNVTVDPDSQMFDPVIDVLDSNGDSILTNGPVDQALAGSAETAAVQLPAAGVYQVLVRGFGFSGGEFSIVLDSQ